jgi:hypothetical protein
MVRLLRGYLCGISRHCRAEMSRRTALQVYLHEAARCSQGCRQHAFASLLLPRTITMKRKQTLLQDLW